MTSYKRCIVPERIALTVTVFTYPALVVDRFAAGILLATIRKT
ncbi:hypothetical protein PAMC26577_14165 [Caballeronia sordidicola]|uniref:Uncharacterized protein n=1 Tax=Caballeronia sordidicola TaxID=196367 RepID=A0A242MUC4_CABSO|nr:hypothetical protein PAMC26577_14165 [Caballeronia sordidicola]